MIFLRLGFLILTLLALANCSFRDEKSAGDTRTVDLNAKFGYGDVSTVVFIPRCLSCHASQKKPSLNTYAEIKANIDKIQQQVFVKGSMPPRAPLPPYERQVLLQWISQGAPEIGDPGTIAVPSPTPSGPIERPVKWEFVRQNVFEPKCFNCHYPHNPDNYTDYTDVNVLKDTMGSILFLSITKPQMPPAPDKLTDMQKDILAAWVIDGMDTTQAQPIPSPSPSPGASPTPNTSPGPSPLPSPSPTP